MHSLNARNQVNFKCILIYKFCKYKNLLSTVQQTKRQLTGRDHTPEKVCKDPVDEICQLQAPPLKHFVLAQKGRRRLTSASEVAAEPCRLSKFWQEYRNGKHCKSWIRPWQQTATSRKEQKIQEDNWETNVGHNSGVWDFGKLSPTLTLMIQTLQATLWLLTIRNFSFCSHTRVTVIRT